MLQFSRLLAAVGVVLSGVAALQSDVSRACTTFALNGGRMVAKSYDWQFDQGLVLVNKRGVEKIGFALRDTDAAPTWTSRYGSVTFNQYGREFPNSGINEAGLVVEVMMLTESAFPPASATPALNETQWVQYQLDRYGTVQEVLQHLHEVRIATALAALHYLACDKEGDCATIEFLAGTPTVHAGSNLPVQVLANDTYAASRDYLRRFTGFGGTEPIPTAGLDSLTRFVRAADHVLHAPLGEDLVAYAFAGIDKVAGDRTQWRIVYEDDAVHFSSLRAAAVKTVHTENLDFGCAAPVLMLPMEMTAGGDATTRLVPYDASANARLVHESLDGSFPAAQIDQVLTTAASSRCVAP